jgi:hypothetical protein
MPLLKAAEKVRVSRACLGAPAHTSMGPADVPVCKWRLQRKRPALRCSRHLSCPQSRYSKGPSTCDADLVFIQNGMLQGWLDARGLGRNTQALIFFAVAKIGDKPTDGITDTNPDGLTAVHGKHAQLFAERLRGAGLSCHVLGTDAYKQAMLEKLVWIWCVPTDLLLQCKSLPSCVQQLSNLQPSLLEACSALLLHEYLLE